jgi:hypothetical protein
VGKGPDTAEQCSILVQHGIRIEHGKSITITHKYHPLTSCRCARYMSSYRQLDSLEGGRNAFHEDSLCDLVRRLDLRDTLLFGPIVCVLPT